MNYQIKQNLNVMIKIVGIKERILARGTYIRCFLNIVIP